MPFMDHQIAASLRRALAGMGIAPEGLEEPIAHLARVAAAAGTDSAPREHVVRVKVELDPEEARTVAGVGHRLEALEQEVARLGKILLPLEVPWQPGAPAGIGLAEEITLEEDL